MYSPLVTTQFVMMQVMTEFAEALGVNRQYAEMLSHIHVLQATSFPLWQKFIVSQCRGCLKSMESCPFIHPGPDNLSPGVTAAEVSTANRAAVACGRITSCPVRATAPQE